MLRLFLGSIIVFGGSAMLTHVDALTTYSLSMGLLVVFLLVWLVHRQRTGQGFNLWLASGVVGILLGSVGSYAIVSAAGFIVVKHPQIVPQSAGVITQPMVGLPAGGGGGGAPAGGMGGGAGMGGGGMGAGGMGGGPNPKRDLTTLVRKLNLLTDDVGIKLSSEQTTALLKGLSGVDGAEKFSDDDAKKIYDELFAVLGDEQKAKLDAVGLPFGGRGGPGGGGGGAGGPGGGGAGGGGAGGPPNPDDNPFRRENNLKALKSFRSRFDAAEKSADEK